MILEAREFTHRIASCTREREREIQFRTKAMRNVRVMIFVVLAALHIPANESEKDWSSSSRSLSRTHIKQDCNKMIDLIIVKCHHNLARHIKNRHPIRNTENLNVRWKMAYRRIVFTCMEPMCMFSLTLHLLAGWLCFWLSCFFSRFYSLSFRRSPGRFKWMHDFVIAQWNPKTFSGRCSLFFCFAAPRMCFAFISIIVCPRILLPEHVLVHCIILE